VFADSPVVCDHRPRTLGVALAGGRPMGAPQRPGAGHSSRSRGARGWARSGWGSTGPSHGVCASAWSVPPPQAVRALRDESVLSRPGRDRVVPLAASASCAV